MRFLEAPEQQRRFQELGFRDHTGAPGPEISERNGLIPAKPVTIAPPGGDVLMQIREDWPEYRKRARVLILMDVSGSMNSVVPGSDQTKLQLAKEATRKALVEKGVKQREESAEAFDKGRRPELAAKERAEGEYLRRYRRNHGVELADALIAASAALNGAELWTRNRKHYPMKELLFFD